MAAMSQSRTRSTFYWAMRLMPRERRAAMFAIYELARALDDIADGTAPRDVKRATLAEWHAEIDRLYASAPTRPLTQALQPVIRRFDLPREEFHQIICGMEMDVEGPLVAPPRAVLDLYCRRVAGAVGLLALPIFGANGPTEHVLALYLGRALQLTNILRDLHADAAAERLYIPEEYLTDVGIEARDPGAVLHHPRFAEAAVRIAEDARSAFSAADRALGDCNRRALWPAIAMLEAYRSLLGRVTRAGFPSSRKVASGGIHALGVALRAAIAARF